MHNGETLCRNFPRIYFFYKKKIYIKKFKKFCIPIQWRLNNWTFCLRPTLGRDHLNQVIEWWLGCWWRMPCDMWQATGEKRQVTGGRWQVTHAIYLFSFIFFKDLLVSMLLSADSVSPVCGIFPVKSTLAERVWCNKKLKV